MNVVGFDFGTTNSLVSVLIPGDKEPLTYLDDVGQPVPSVVCYEGDRPIVGREAKKRVAQAGLGVQGNIVRSPKRELGEDTIVVGGKERHTTEIVADVVRHVLDTARKRGLESVSDAVVTIPVDMDGRRRRALREAFRQANLGIVQFVHEPLAALYGTFKTRGFTTMARRYDGQLIYGARLGRWDAGPDAVPSDPGHAGSSDQLRNRRRWRRRVRRCGQGLRHW